MTETEFCRWLWGFIELHGEVPTPGQWKQIKAHLGLLYEKVTPQEPPPVVTTTPDELAAMKKAGRAWRNNHVRGGKRIC